MTNQFVFSLPAGTLVSSIEREADGLPVMVCSPPVAGHPDVNLVCFVGQHVGADFKFPYGFQLTQNLARSLPEGTTIRFINAQSVLVKRNEHDFEFHGTETIIRDPWNLSGKVASIEIPGVPRERAPLRHFKGTDWSFSPTGSSYINLNGIAGMEKAVDELIKLLTSDVVLTEREREVGKGLLKSIRCRIDDQESADADAEMRRILDTVRPVNARVIEREHVVGRNLRIPASCLDGVVGLKATHVVECEFIEDLLCEDV